MGKVIPMAGGGGADSDELTANRSHVLSGYTAITHDSDGEAGAGTMPNNGAQNGALNCGQSKTIPAGYTTGGTVTANSLASQTAANAGSGQILTGYNAWVNGSKITGNMANKGAWTGSAAMNGKATIPAGYHNGSGYVNGPSITDRGAWTTSIGINGKATIPAGYHNGSGYVNQGIATMGGQTITPATSQQTVSCSGKYMTGNIVVKGYTDYSYLAQGQTVF